MAATFATDARAVAVAMTERLIAAMDRLETDATHARQEATRAHVSLAAAHRLMSLPS
jgi:hypothetical protein